MKRFATTTTFKKLRMLSIVLIVTGLLLGTSSNPAHAQDPPEKNAPAQISLSGWFSQDHPGKNAAAQVSLSGWFSIIWGDSKDGKSHMIYTLTDEKKQRTILQLDETVVRKLGGVLKFNGKYVRVQGTLATPSYTEGTSGSAESPTAVLNVISISLAPSPGAQAPAIYDVTALAVSGSHPWVTIMCKFSDIAAEPNDTAYFQGMYGDTHPGLNHYWKELSFDTADVTGSTVGGTGWYDLPNTESYYNPTDTEKGTDLTLLAQECIDAVDADVDFSLYSGINMMFNSDFDNGWAWGGGWNDTLDGVTKTWSITWEPPWSYHNISVIAHEMGHGFGLPHSSYDRVEVYDNPWDVMSQDRYNCAAATDPTYGCIAQHTISYHKDLLDWIPGPRKTTVAADDSDTVILEDLAAPATTNYQMVSIPIGGSATNFYTVEARRFTGYDVKLPDEGVIIHNVDTTEGIPAVLEPDAGDREDPWNVGETFIDATNSIAVIVRADTGSGFQVTVSNGNLPPTSDAGGPYAAECMAPATTVALDGSGSSDPEGSSLTYSWSRTCEGTFDDPTIEQPTLTVNTSNVCTQACSVSLTVTDNEDLMGVSDSAIVTILDTTPPTLVGVPIDETVECDAVPPPAVVTATDTCDTNVTPSFEETRVDGSCPDKYTLTRTWTATDGCGNSISSDQIITVQDTTAPVIDNLAASPDTLWPPNHKMVSVTVAVDASDNCDAQPMCQITSVSSNETANGSGDGNTASDWEITGDLTVKLRAERSGTGDGRFYTITVTCADACGNSSEEATAVVTVPHDKGKGKSKQYPKSL
jgi:M6 family metalloprotease-like protein